MLFKTAKKYSKIGQKIQIKYDEIDSIKIKEIFIRRSVKPPHQNVGGM